jgi:hypothetical protein
MSRKEGGMMRMRFLIAAAFLLAAGAAFAADQMSVIVSETRVMATPSALAASQGVLNYGDRVTVLEQPAGSRKDWLKVRGPDGKVVGWVRISALDKRVVAMKAGSGAAAQSASSGDVVAAGKGFNSDVEAEYKRDQKLDYTWVDNMQGDNDKKKEFMVSPQMVAAFMSAGGLTDEGRAQ